MFNRRQFLKSACSAGALLLSQASCKKTDAGIESIELFLINIEKERHFSHGSWTTRQHAILRFSTQSASGWAEMRISKNDPDIDVRDWGRFLEALIGLTIDDAFEFLVRHRGEHPWNRRVVEAVDMALWDIRGRLLNTPAVDLLGLKSRSTVSGLFCILEKDVDRVKKQARLAIKQGLDSHIKLKIFGNAESDATLIRAVREIVGPNTFIIADPNRGYRDWANLNDLALSLIYLHDHGLNGCEDPADLSMSQWIDLQQRVGGLKLIPDKPLRPAWKSIHTVEKGMGKIYNLHPGTMGTLTEMAALIRKIKSWNADVMIGDDSLVGAACTAWQQIAIGAGAVCVEALEKPHENRTFLGCIRSKATFMSSDGKISMKNLPGFGLDVDVTALKKKCDDYNLIKK